MLQQETISNLLEQQETQVLVNIHNAYCKETQNKEKYIYENTPDNVTELLPENPYDAFIEGRYVGTTYQMSDIWLQLDGSGHISSTSDPVNNFLFLYDLTRWLDKKGFDSEEELTDFIEEC